MWTRGFLGNDASFMLDFVVCALVLVVPILVYSLYQVKIRRNYSTHKRLQLALGGVLLVTVVAFEADMQLHGGWKQIVNKEDSTPRLDATELARVERILWIHLVFAISTPVLWLVTTVLALKRFPRPPQPGPHSRLHKTLGWLSTLDLVLTSVTGLIFYYAAFMA
jgi:putative membrane protein